MFWREETQEATGKQRVFPNFYRKTLRRNSHHLFVVRSLRTRQSFAKENIGDLLIVDNFFRHIFGSENEHVSENYCNWFPVDKRKTLYPISMFGDVGPDEVLVFLKSFFPFMSSQCEIPKIPDDKFLERKVIGDRIHGDFLWSYQTHMSFF